MRAANKRVLVLALTTSVICLAWLARPAEHRLMDRAVPVAGVHPGDGRDGYYWLSNHDLLLFHQVRALRWTVARRDTRAKTETPLPALDALFRQTGGQPDSVKVSPDGTRLIWAGIGKMIYGATVGGSQFQQWPYGKHEGGISHWMDDSRRFVRLEGNQFFDPRPMALRDIASPHQVRRLPLLWLQSGVTRAALASLIAARRSSTSVYAEAGADGGEVTVSLFGPAGVQEGTAEVPLPPGDERSSCSDPRFLSDGDALIWTLTGPPPPRTPAPLWGLLARAGWRPRRSQTVRVYASRADGTHWRFVGDWEEPATNISGDDLETHPHNLRWVPGGRRMSFEHLGALYVVPAGP